MRTARTRSLANYDVVVSVSAGATAMILMKRPRRVVLQAHGTAAAELLANIRVRPRLWLLKALRYLIWLPIDLAVYARADRVVAVSDPLATRLRRSPYRFAIRRGKLASIPNGVDLRRPLSLEALGHPEGGGALPTRVIAVGRLVRQKGFDRCIRALAETEGCTLRIVGEGPERRVLERLVSAMHVSMRVAFAGHVPNEAIAAELASADVLVFSARHAEREGLPTVILEALQLGLRVLVPEALLLPADLEALVDRVDMGDPVMLASAITRPRQHTQPPLPQRYTLDACVSSYEELFTVLASSSR
jgi:glycosyltransferase involved in cell wall biosynthesis